MAAARPFRCDRAGAAMPGKYDHLSQDLRRHIEGLPLLSGKFIDPFQARRKRAAPQVHARRKRAAPQAEFAARALKAIFPNGLPDQATLPNSYLIRQVRDYFKKVGDRSISDDSILRAAGRKKTRR